MTDYETLDILQKYIKLSEKELRHIRNILYDMNLDEDASLVDHIIAEKYKGGLTRSQYKGDLK